MQNQNANLCLPNCKPSQGKIHRRHREGGQVIIEYILLMVVALGLATLIMKSVVSRDPGESGFLMRRWQAMLEQIAKDDPNKRTSQ